MRIVGGKHRGRRLLTPQDSRIRPTSDRTREAMFNILEHATWMPPLEDFTVLDAFCGTGALGLEALSRGARHATFMDKSRASLDLARQNAETFGELPACTFLLSDAARPPRTAQPCSLVFLDPPYGQGLVQAALKALVAAGWIADRSVIIAEMAATDKPSLEIPEHYQLLDSRTYGDTWVAFLGNRHGI